MNIDPSLPEQDRLVLRVDVPGDPPSLNETYRARAIVRGRKAFAQFYKSAKVRAWQASVTRAATTSTPQRQPWFTGCVRVDLFCRFRRIDRDIDGPVKATLDALQDVAYADDRQVKMLVVESKLDRENPGVTIFVSER